MLQGNNANIEIFITRVKSNIQTFNQHVNLNKEVSKARGEKPDDLMTNMFKEYHEVWET